MVIDLQFGSTGKGLLVGWLAERGSHDTIMSAWAPNAGHTYIDQLGRKYVHTMLPNGIIGPYVRRVMMGPGSILNLDKLQEEINECRDVLDGNRISIFIHPNAAIVTQEDIDIEYKTMVAIGSTKKGVGEAAINKIRRNPDRPCVAYQFKNHPIFDDECVHLVANSQEWIAIYGMARKVLIEGAQGFGLSIHHGFYPYTTSRDITPSQILADCGVPFKDAPLVKVHGTCRTYPIRVANRFDENGKQVGYSGPCYPDQVEIQWSDIHREVELTTVTKLPRRLFSFSYQQMYVATAMCSPHVIFLNFVNYVNRYETFEQMYEFLSGDGTEIILGVGPAYGDVLHNLPTSPRKVWDIVIARR